MVKLFLAAIFPSLSTLIWLDSDMLVMEDVAVLYREFGCFDHVDGPASIGVANESQMNSTVYTGAAMCGRVPHVCVCLTRWPFQGEKWLVTYGLRVPPALVLGDPEPPGRCGTFPTSLVSTSELRCLGKGVV